MGRAIGARKHMGSRGKVGAGLLQSTGCHPGPRYLMTGKQLKREDVTDSENSSLPLLKPRQDS